VFERQAQEGHLEDGGRREVGDVEVERERERGIQRAGFVLSLLLFPVQFCLKGVGNLC